MSLVYFEIVEPIQHCERKLVLKKDILIFDKEFVMIQLSGKSFQILLYQNIVFLHLHFIFFFLLPRSSTCAFLSPHCP